MKEVKWCPQHGYPMPCQKCEHLPDLNEVLESIKRGLEDAKEGRVSKIKLKDL